MSYSSDDFNSEYFEDDEYEPITPYRPGIIGTLVILLVLISLLATLVWPLIPQGHPQPTPTPIFWERIETASIPQQVAGS